MLSVTVSRNPKCIDLFLCENTETRLISMDLTFGVQTSSPLADQGPVLPADGHVARLLSSRGKNQKSPYGDLIPGCLMDSKDILNIHHCSFYEHLGNSLQR